nr:unnamed protein product [Spirometra erinaceieuropaei]
MPFLPPFYSSSPANSSSYFNPSSSCYASSTFAPPHSLSPDWQDNPGGHPTGTEDGAYGTRTGALQGDIAALNETRFSEEGQLEEMGAGFTFFWRCRPRTSDETRVSPSPSGTTSWDDCPVCRGA